MSTFRSDLFEAFQKAVFILLIEILLIALLVAFLILALEAVFSHPLIALICLLIAMASGFAAFYFYPRYVLRHLED